MTEDQRPESNWFVENDEILALSLDELRALAITGKIGPHVRVRKDDLRWLEAGKVPALADCFAVQQNRAEPTAELVATSVETTPVPEASGLRGAASPVVKAVWAFILLSFAITYLIMYYRGKADKMDAGKLPEVQQLHGDYAEEKRFLERQVEANEQAIVAIEKESKTPPASIDTAYCSRINTNNINSNTQVVLDGRPYSGSINDLYNECVRRFREAAEAKAAEHKNYITSTRGKLMEEKTGLDNDLRNLDLDTKGEQNRIVGEKETSATKGRFVSTYIPVSLGLIFLAISAMAVTKLREYNKNHAEMM